MKKILLIAILILAFLVSGFLAYASYLARLKETIELTGKNLAIPLNNKPLAGKNSFLFNFNKSDYESALKSDKLILLYFYNQFCPICHGEFPHMEDAFDELETDDVVGFRVNFRDLQTDADEKKLARKFGIGYQHTKVFVKDGKRVLKSPKVWKQADYESEITKFLSTEVK